MPRVTAAPPGGTHGSGSGRSCRDAAAWPGRSRIAAFWRKQGRAVRCQLGCRGPGGVSLTNSPVSITSADAGRGTVRCAHLIYVTSMGSRSTRHATATDPLLVRFSGTDLPAWRRAVASCTGTAAVTGLVAGVCVLAAAALLGGPTRLAFLALGLTLPGLLLQDSWRFAFFALGRGSRHSATRSGRRGSALVLPGRRPATRTCSGLSSRKARRRPGAVGPLQARVVPRLSRTREWLSQQRDLGFRHLWRHPTAPPPSCVTTASASFSAWPRLATCRRPAR
jgi:hypothetical protein